MKKILLFFVFSIAANAQTPGVAWVKTLNGPLNEKIRDVAVDFADNKYIIGTTTSVYYGFGNVQHESGSRSFVSKLDSNDNEVIHQQFPDVDLMRVRTDLSGNVYITGIISSPVTFGTITISPLSGADSFIAKYTANMDLVWVKRIASNNNSAPTDIEVRNNTILLTGNIDGGAVSIGTQEFANPFGASGIIANLDLNGTVNWIQFAKIKIATYDVKANSAIDLSGNCIVSATYSGAVTIGSNSLTSNGSSDGVLLKYSPTGILQWVKSYGGNGPDEPAKVAVDAAGNILLAGTADYNMTIGTTLSGDDTMSYISKIAANGNIAWTKKLAQSSGTWVEGIAVDNSGSILINSTLINSQNFGSFNASFTGWDFVQALIKCDATGNALWVKQLASVNLAPATNLQLSPLGDTYFYAIHMMPSITIDNVTLPNLSNVTTAGVYKYDSYLAKLPHTALNSPDFEVNQIALWPNPARDILHVSGVESNRFAIYDLSGRLIKTGITGNGAPIDVAVLSSGTYILKIDLKVWKFVKV